MRDRLPAPVAGALTLLALSSVPAGAGAAERERTHTVALYALGIGLDGQVAVGPRTADIDVSASEILDSLEFGAMGSYRYAGERWTVQVDAIYADLAAEKESAQGAARARVDLTEAMIEVDLGFRLSDNVEVLVGARYWDYDANVTLVGTGPVGTAIGSSGSANWVDPIVGMRVRVPIGANWTFVGRGDVGGFDVGSKFAWQATAFFDWRVSPSVSVLLGYRAFKVEFDDDSGPVALGLDLLQSGPGIGVAISF